jgi:DNA-binding transcriptional LysR family regulator
MGSIDARRLRVGIHIAFVRPSVSDHSFMSEVVIREALVVALPPKHRIASRARLPLSDLGNELFILPPRDVVPVFHDAVLKACRAAEFTAWSLRARVLRSFPHPHA